MGKLVSDRTAEWLTDQMQRGNSRTRLRRIMSDEAEGEGGASCIPVEIKGMYNGSNSYLGWYFAIIGKDYGRRTERETEPIYLPHISQSTNIPQGTCVLAHQVGTIKVNSSND